MRPVTTTTFVLVTMALTACAGPKAPYEVGTQAAPVNLVLGAHDAVVRAPVGPVTVPLPPGLAPFLPLPNVDVPEVPTVAPPDLGPCPDVDKYAPSIATSVALPGPPQPGTYQYRAKVTETVGKTKASLLGNSTWKVTVGAVDPTTKGYHVTLDVSLGTSKSTRVFLVMPKAVNVGQPDVPLVSPDDPATTDPNYQVIAGYNATVAPYGLPQLPSVLPNLGRFGPAGIYLVSQSADGRTFTPTVPIPLVQTPIGSNSFTGVGTDGVTAMSFVSTVKKRVNVNACGKKLEAYEVELTGGTIAGLTEDGKVTQVGFDETFDFGIQFGGLPLRDVGSVTALTLPGGAVVPDEIERTFAFTINSRPKPARV